MKKIILLQLVLCLCFCLCACSQNNIAPTVETICSSNEGEQTDPIPSNPKETPTNPPVDPPTEATIPQCSDIEKLLEWGFNDHYLDGYSRDENGNGLYMTAEEYRQYCDLLSEKSLMPYDAINGYFIEAYSREETYNSITEHYYIVDFNGEIFKDCGEFDSAYVQTVGDKIVVQFAVGEWDKYNTGIPLNIWGEYEIWSETGELLNKSDDDIGFDGLTVLSDLGDGNYLCRNSHGKVYQYGFYLFTKTGELHELSISIQSTPYISNYKDLLGLITVGPISEKYFSLLFEDDDNYGGICAFYFDENGEEKIDLSTSKTNFNVIELGKFENGQAQILFIGIDGKSYKGIIGTDGQFIGEPTVN